MNLYFTKQLFIQARTRWGFMTMFKWTKGWTCTIKTRWTCWRALWNLWHNTKKFSHRLLVAYVTKKNNQDVPNMWCMRMTWTLEHHKKGTLMGIIVIWAIHEVGIRLHGTNQTNNEIYRQSIHHSSNGLHFKMGGSKSFERWYSMEHYQISKWIHHHHLVWLPYSSCQQSK